MTWSVGLSPKPISGHEEVAFLSSPGGGSLSVDWVANKPSSQALHH